MTADSSARRPLYRVAFINDKQIYEVYARSVSPSDLMGFVQIEELVFGERSAVVVDPAEEKLASEFANVQRSHIPMHSIIRIDEVDRRGTARITDTGSDNSKVAPFRSPYGGLGPRNGGPDT